MKFPLSAHAQRPTLSPVPTAAVAVIAAAALLSIPVSFPMSHAPDAISYPGKRPGLLVLAPSSLGCQKKNPPMRITSFPSSCSTTCITSFPSSWSFLPLHFPHFSTSLYLPSLLSRPLLYILPFLFSCNVPLLFPFFYSPLSPYPLLSLPTGTSCVFSCLITYYRIYAGIRCEFSDARDTSSNGIGVLLVFTINGETVTINLTREIATTGSNYSQKR